MQLNDLSQSDLSIVCKLFGSLFYYQPKEYEQLPIGAYFSHDDVTTPIDEINQILNAFKYADQGALQVEHEQLFTMQEMMPAPPWSSMYLDRESIVFGKANNDYSEFVEHCGLSLREGASDPEDHIGLMLIVLGMLIDDKQDQHAKEMIGEYLATWSGFYFSRLKEVTEEESPYSKLADYTASLLEVLRKQYSVQVLIKNNFFQPPH
ncbi:dehydrogenase [Vibrio albus]|uniref:Dehydrogenase n=1 Tax=Vibrio albus TaxID=2200953 RepID=A0A2U3B5Z8_9VIBR|nr:molecular chaperone TorD family protein [Vibrio albus]PWI32226.1 dehydrogenase [Vibrio albus]